MAMLLLAVLAVTPAYADNVEIGVGGNLLGEYALHVGESLSEGFVLNKATNITSFNVGINPDDYGMGWGDYQLSVVGPGGINYWSDTTSQPISSILPAGSYSIVFTGLSCEGQCVGDVVASWDYYAPATYSETGGTVEPGNYGFDLTGTTVGPLRSNFGPVIGIAPEPGTVTLVGIGLLGLTGLMRRKLAAH